MFTLRLLSPLLLATTALASPLSLSPRAVIAHDQVVGFPQTVPSGLNGQLYLKYKPYLEVSNGCVPFPAVNSVGDTRFVNSFPFYQHILSRHIWHKRLADASSMQWRSSYLRRQQQWLRQQ